MSDLLSRLAAALADRYRLSRELGAGGMATVWLAEDLRHGRQVAIKVLHPELSAVLGPERFLAEIKLTAALQHPHILPLFDSGSADGLLFYVMPFVEGETLRTRLTREHQLPVAEAVRLAREVADALSYAHQKGIVHRDIKPENILLQNGHALVADFGIALAVQEASGARMTQTGLSLGTPHYMSPEQALGEREITARSDVYALGCVLYEMLAGEPPFTGATAQAVLARVMTDAPRPLAAQRHTVPAHVEAAVRQALEKLPADRFATAGEFAAALGDATFTGTAVPPAAAPAPAGRPRAARLLAPLAAVAVAALALAGWALLRPAPRAPVQRFTIAFARGQTPGENVGFLLAPDGSAFYYRAPGPGGMLIWRKARDSWTAAPVAGTENATFSGVSPDGQWLAFVQEGKLRKVPVTGGAAMTLVNDGVMTGGTWLDDGTLLYLGSDRRILRVPADGGAPTVAWADTMALYTHMRPLPGARGALVTRCTRPCGGAYEVTVLDLRSGELHSLYRGAVLGFYVRTGHVAVVRPDGALLALPFDLGRLEATGDAVSVGDSVVVLEGRNPHIAYADDGTLIARFGVVGLSAPTFRMVWVDRRGQQAVVDTAWTFRHAAFGGNAGWSLSPDGTRIAIGLNTPAGDDIWVKQLPRGPLTRVTFDSAPDFRPRWTPDGRHLLFSSIRAPQGLYRRAADGTGRDTLVLAGAIYEGVPSRDGAWLLGRAGGVLSASGGRNIGAMRLGADTGFTPLVATNFDESEIALSPDGTWLAYVSDETGRAEVYVRPFPDVNRARWQVSTAGGVSPVWARDGRELFFVNAARELHAVRVPAGSAFAPGEPQVLFRLGDEIYPLDREFYPFFDVSPDGQRFLMARYVRTAGEPGTTPLQVTLNWHEDLRKRLGGR